MNRRQLVVMLVALLLSTCGPAVTDVPSEPTSSVEDTYDLSMIHRGTFRITVTGVQHLSIAIWVKVDVENVSGQAAEWRAVLTDTVYVLDAGNKLFPEDIEGIFAEDATFAPGAREKGSFTFDLPNESLYQFYFPDCEPAFVTLKIPGH